MVATFWWKEMTVESLEIEIESGRRIVTDLTDAVVRFCRGRGDGLVNVFVPHATAGLALMEVGSGSEVDLATVIESLLPSDRPYQHRHGSLGHGRDHVLPAFVTPSLTIPTIGGEPKLGVWQSLVLVDTNGDNPRRRVRFSFLGG
jgi:secondary thiamine-phosphate synthase enzyme